MNSSLSRVKLLINSADKLVSIIENPSWPKYPLLSLPLPEETKLSLGYPGTGIRSRPISNPSISRHPLPLSLSPPSSLSTNLLTRLLFLVPLVLISPRKRIGGRFSARRRIPWKKKVKYRFMVIHDASYIRTPSRVLFFPSPPPPLLPSFYPRTSAFGRPRNTGPLYIGIYIVYIGCVY